MVTYTARIDFADGTFITGKVEVKTPQDEHPVIEYGGEVERLTDRPTTGDPWLVKVVFEEEAGGGGGQFSEAQDGEYDSWAE